MPLLSFSTASVRCPDHDQEWDAPSVYYRCGCPMMLQEFEEAIEFYTEVAMTAPSNAELLAAVQEEFVKLLAEKTSWGRNEIALLFEKAKSQAMLRFI